MAYTYYRPRGDTKANWEEVNPILKEREMGVEWEEEIGHGSPRIKFGSGYTNWKDLDYAFAVAPSYDADTRTIKFE